MNSKAIITGVTGQDGFYLSRWLLSLGYEVIGIRRRKANPTTADERMERLRDTVPNFHLVDGDITDMSSIMSVMSIFEPDEFYHLAAQSHVGKSWGMAGATLQITGIGTYNCLEAVRRVRPDCHFYFAGSSEQFGNTGLGSTVLDETSAMHPESPYAAAKVLGYNLAQVYRHSYDMFVSCGILFNHESPIRGEEFVTRKITSQLARIKSGTQKKLSLGNIYATRDWGFAGDYVKAMHAMLHIDEPGDFVIATGENHSVGEFLDLACDFYDLNREEVLDIDPSMMRPQDVQDLLGDASRAKRLLGWEPETTFNGLVETMCEFDLANQVNSMMAEELL